MVHYRLLGDWAIGNRLLAIEMVPTAMRGGGGGKSTFYLHDLPDIRRIAGGEFIFLDEWLGI